MNLNSQRLNVVCAVCSTGEVLEKGVKIFTAILINYRNPPTGKVELNLVPAVIKTHRHCTDKWLDPCCRLIVWSPEPSSDILVIQNLSGQVRLQKIQKRLTMTSKVKYFFKFLIIMTKNGSLMPRVALASSCRFEPVVYIVKVWTKKILYSEPNLLGK